MRRLASPLRMTWATPLGVAVGLGCGPAPGMNSTWPTYIRLGSAMPLAATMAATVVPKRWAMLYRVSPCWTVYEKPAGGGVGVGDGDGVAVAVGSTEGVGLGPAVGSPVDVGEGKAVAVCDGDGDAVGVGWLGPSPPQAAATISAT